MTTVVVKTIGTGGDYSTIAAWFAACPANLVTADQVWQGQLLNQAFVVSSGPAVTFSGVTTDATRYVELRCAAGASWSDNAANALRLDTAQGAYISCTGAYSAGGIVISMDNVKLTGLQILKSGNGASYAIHFGVGSQVVDIDRCIIATITSGTGGCVELIGASAIIRNSLCLMLRGGLRIATFTSGAQAHGCTFATPTNVTAPTVVFEGAYGTPVITNCAMFSRGATLKTGGNTPTYTNCKSDSPSLPSGVTSATYNTSLFNTITSANPDYRTPTGSALINAGTTDATYSAHDCFNTARPQGASYDVGAYEFPVASGSVGSSSGAGAAAGVGKSKFKGVASSAGTGAAAAVGRSTTRVVAASAGSGSASGIGKSQARTVGSSAGIGSAAATGVGASHGTGVGSSDGLATVTGVSKATKKSVGAADGAGAVSGVGKSSARAVGAAAGTGAATAVGRSSFRGVGSTAGVGTVQAVARADARTVGESSGAGDAEGVGVGGQQGQGDGSSTGTGTATGIAKATARAAGSAAGAATVSGVGAARYRSRGDAGGTSDVQARGAALARSSALSEGFGEAIGRSPVRRVVKQARVCVSDGAIGNVVVAVFTAPGIRAWDVGFGNITIEAFVPNCNHKGDCPCR